MFVCFVPEYYVIWILASFIPRELGWEPQRENEYKDCAI
jgi:hypothetical protein